MQFSTYGERRYAHFEQFAVPGLIHAFTTRPHDVSARADTQSDIRNARRAETLTDFGLDPNRLHYCVQVHEPRVLIVDQKTPAGAHEGYDALITAERGATLMNFSADCPLLLIFDMRKNLIAQAHASWRCTVARIAKLVVEILNARFRSRPADLIAGIGPSAGPCCYEVKDDVRSAAESAGLRDMDEIFPRQHERMCFDLWRANRDQLIETGIESSRIEVAGICTMCRNDLFFSFRREGAGCGHFGLLSSLQP